MKSKLVKRLLSLILATAILASGMAVMATDVPTPYYDATAKISASLSISSSGLASCGGSIRLSDSSCYANLTLKLQKKRVTVGQHYIHGHNQMPPQFLVLDMLLVDIPIV